MVLMIWGYLKLTFAQRNWLRVAANASGPDLLIIAADRGKGLGFPVSRGPINHLH